LIPRPPRLSHATTAFRATNGATRRRTAAKVLDEPSITRSRHAMGCAVPSTCDDPIAGVNLASGIGAYGRCFKSTATQMVYTCQPHMRSIRSRGCGFPRERNRTYVICGVTG
jgi:hypothetical protein